MTRGVVLFGHGSRDPEWRRPMDAIAGAIRTRAPGVAVACAFLELQAPTLADAVAEMASGGASEVTVFPMFLGMGRHAREDLPKLVGELRLQHPGLQLVVLPAAGEHQALVDLLADLALGWHP